MKQGQKTSIDTQQGKTIVVTDRQREMDRETGLNIGNKIKYLYYSFYITKLQTSKENMSRNKMFYKQNIYT